MDYINKMQSKSNLSLWLPVILWMGFIFALSAQPKIQLSPEPFWDLTIKKTGHFDLYFVLSILLQRALSGGIREFLNTSRRTFILATLISTLYAISDETHQMFVPGRGPSALDVGIDVAGAEFAFGVVALARMLLILDGAICIAKTLIDYVVAVVALAALSPLLLVIAVSVKLDSPGPVFYRRLVVGKGGKNFRLLKFRTMVADAEEMLLRDERLRREFERNFKLQNDPRVTRVGKLLRRYSLDELPQFINVLAGQMSLVGPRTIGPEELHKYGDWKADLLTVKPGLTGLWQISGRSDIPYEERVKIDVHYVRSQSIWMDLRIILRTLPVVLRGKGAY